MTAAALANRYRSPCSGAVLSFSIHFTPASRSRTYSLPHMHITQMEKMCFMCVAKVVGFVCFGWCCPFLIALCVRPFRYYLFYCQYFLSLSLSLPISLSCSICSVLAFDKCGKMSSPFAIYERNEIEKGTNVCSVLPLLTFDGGAGRAQENVVMSSYTRQSPREPLLARRIIIDAMCAGDKQSKGANLQANAMRGRTNGERQKSV